MNFLDFENFWPSFGQIFGLNLFGRFQKISIYFSMIFLNIPVNLSKITMFAGIFLFFWFLLVVLNGVSPLGALCVQMDFMRTFQGNAKWNNINPVWSQFYKTLVVFKYHRSPWVNLFDKDIFRCINTYIKVVYWAFFRILMLLKMSVLKILTKGPLWYFKNTKIL